MRKNKKRFCSTLIMLAALAGGLPHATAAKAAAAPEAPLSAAGQRLMEQYAAELAALKAELAKALPAVDERKQAAFQQAQAAVKQATAAAQAAQQPLDKIAGAQGLVGHRKGKWIGGAEKGIAAAEAALKKAATDAEREAAKKELAHWQADLAAGKKALVEAQAALDQAQADEAKYVQASKAAQAALAGAQADELKAAKVMLADVMPFLSSDQLDARLVKGAVLAQATPRGLAEFAQQGREQEALVEKLLADTALMKAMLMAEGAKAGKYGRAMQIYTAIQQASPRAKAGVFQRLALGTSLEHAVPVAQNNPKAEANAPAVVDPVQRYLHFEKACLGGELDPAFQTLSAWEYRNVVNGDEPDQALTWGREMLRNYRPDHILNSDYGWRYSGLVRTDVRYGSQDVKNDLPTLQNNQNIIRNGGVCGRRAFFGRFILRCFGIPTVARPQSGHAALVHWTPNGWVPNLGGGWGCGWTPYGGSDLDLLANTQARKSAPAYLQVQRAWWVGDVLGEPRAFGLSGAVPGFWNRVALYRQRVLVAESKAVTLAALGQELGEANESAETRAMAVAKATVTAADKQIAVAPNGVITIPAAACRGAQLMNSFLGGQQMFCGGNFTCDVAVPNAGQYALAARVVTVQDNPQLQLAVNGAPAPVAIAVPYTGGQWQQTAPAHVALVKGPNRLQFARPAGSRGLTIKEITLTPVR